MKYYYIHYSYYNGSYSTERQEHVIAVNEEDAILRLKTEQRANCIISLKESKKSDYDKQQKFRADVIRWNDILKD